MFYNWWFIRVVGVIFFRFSMVIILMMLRFVVVKCEFRLMISSEDGFSLFVVFI